MKAPIQLLPFWLSFSSVLFLCKPAHSEKPRKNLLHFRRRPSPPPVSLILV